jgi:hypothetical protein
MNRTTPTNEYTHQMDGKMILKAKLKIMIFAPILASTMPDKSRVMNFRSTGPDIRPGSRVPNAHMTNTSPRTREAVLQVRSREILLGMNAARMMKAVPAIRPVMAISSIVLINTLACDINPASLLR